MNEDDVRRLLDEQEFRRTVRESKPTTGYLWVLILGIVLGIGFVKGMENNPAFEPSDQTHIVK